MKFSVFGDWGYYTIHREYISQTLKEKKTDFNILLGDNFYPRGISNDNNQQFDRYEKDFGCTKNFVILGNHDWLGDVGAQIFYSLHSRSWTMPFFFYDFIQKDIHFIMLDTCSIALETTHRLTEVMGKPFQDIQDRLISLKKKQMEWLEKTLRNSTAKIKIVCGHYPIFSNGMHGNNHEMIRDVLPLLRHYEVSMYLSGHDHSMQHIQKDGIDFYVLGSASESSYIVTTQDGTKSGYKTCGFALFSQIYNGFEIELNDEYGQVLEYNLYFKK